MQILGILNLTPDSFSDQAPENALKVAEEMLSNGASFIDVGAESTRPDANPLTWQEEWQRLEPFLRQTGNLPLSIDTYHPETAEKALKFPQVEYINDVNGMKDDEMARIIAQNQANIILMHSLTVPADRQIVIKTDPVQTLLTWIEDISTRLKNFQIPAKNVILDIGIGFGKTTEQSIELLKNIGVLAQKTHGIGAKILVGHSRKSFLTKYTDKTASERDFETALVTNYLASQNVDYVRVHNVGINKQAIKIGGALF